MRNPSLRRKKQQRHELSTAPTPCSPEGEEVEESGVKLSSGRRDRVREGVFKSWVHFSLPYPDLTGNKLN